ncbi:MAG: hypothetical protein JWR37_1933 [Mycobacterium sp.]|jgi:cell filamentation protein|nr:hypothetical protein [Mycobacterium sp.]
MAGPRDALPASLRHAVDQTVAAERLEGWQPIDDDIGALVALARDEVAFGEYLGAYLVRHPPAARPPVRDLHRVFRRRRPYLIPGTALLRNNFGAQTRAMLQALEFVATAGRILQWHRKLTDVAIGAQEVDARVLHQHVFADVYPWAGSYRITELRLGETVFARRSTLPAAMAELEGGARMLAATGSGLDAAGLAYEFARLYADYNQIHPFREGNGRTGTLLLHTVAALCGRRLDLTTVTRGEWYAASRDSTPLRRDGRAHHRPFIPLFVRAMR